MQMAQPIPRILLRNPITPIVGAARKNRAVDSEQMGEKAIA
jgi:hypothetical protein